MKKRILGRAVLLAALSGTLVVAGCGGDGDVTPIDLATDNNQDNIPDELELVVKNALKIADRGIPGVLEPEEEPDFFAAINDIGERLPFKTETVNRLGEIEVLQEKIQNAKTEEELTDLMTQLAETDDLLLQDNNYRIFSEALSIMPDLSPSAATAETRQMAKATAQNGFDQLQRGDVMLIHSGGIGKVFPWAWHFTHAGTYDGSNTVYESVSHGVLAQPIEGWKGKKRYAFGRNKVKSQSEVVASLDRAKSKSGTDGRTKYNVFFPNKQTDNSLYCSQLVWKIQQGVGSDVDSNSLKWFALIALKASPIYILNPVAAAAKHAALIATVLRPAVAPDEIYYATNVINFYYDK